MRSRVFAGTSSVDQTQSGLLRFCLGDELSRDRLDLIFGKKMRDGKGGREGKREGKRNWGEKKKEKEKKKWPNPLPSFLVEWTNAKCL